MNNQVIGKLTSFAITSAMLLTVAAMPVEAAWQDNSGNLDFGRDDSTSNTLVAAGGAIAVGVGIWAIVRHSKKKKMRKLERQILERKAQLLPATGTDAVLPVESPDAGGPSFDEAIQRMIDMRAAAVK